MHTQDDNFIEVVIISKWHKKTNH